MLINVGIMQNSQRMKEGGGRDRVGGGKGAAHV